MITVMSNKVMKNEFIHKLKIRGDMHSGSYAQSVKRIVEDVRVRGDEALFEYTQKWDSEAITSQNAQVPYEKMKEAYERLGGELKEALILARDRIQLFHNKQKQNTWMDIAETGEILGQRIMPIERVGVYVPGGKAAYPSSVLMNVIPAKVAGVEKIVMVTPLTKQLQGELPQNVLAAAYLAGVDELYTVGGAQAIAALAFGTETIPKVDKIVGPGNIYVALAKREVYGYVSIDAIAGPSEILIIADKNANPTYLAADLLSQAEHDELASAILVTDDSALAYKVKAEVERLCSLLPRQDILSASLKDYSAIIIEENLEEAIQFANQIAPEHLEIVVENPFEVLSRIKHAGAIFLGQYTPEPIGDYLAGPNHVLPTSGTARFFSPLGVDDFINKSSLLSFSQKALQKVGREAIVLAESENLYAHALSVKIRLEEGSKDE